ncbi:MAG: hypothetical protein ACJA2S_004487 [Cyclobacteriaceae bacterium]|jgi:hypothetical protein
MKNIDINIRKQYQTSRRGIAKFLAVTLVIVSMGSCDETEFLEEVPIDFYSPENSYVTSEQFQSAIVGLHATFRTNFWGQSGQSGSPRLMWYGTDLVMNDKDLGQSPPDYVSLLDPTQNRVKYVWVQAYKMIFDANVVIGRSEAPDSQLSDSERTLVQAEASFFRALGYKMLANLYGGVPLVLEETSSPKRDFARATRAAVYEQCAKDLEFAVASLPDISQVEDHRISKEAANHLLAEIYVSLGDWTKAISAASAVIDNGSMGLMKSRFGSRMNDTDFGGDVYWDLFRQENQNRSSGNTESLWVIQFEYLASGGGDGEFLLERFTIPRYWRADINDTDGEKRSLLAGGPNTNYYGRGSGFQRPTTFFYNELWNSSGGTDIRNSEFNIVRDFKVNNPASPSDGEFVIANNLQRLNSYTDSARNFYPAVAKNSSIGRHPTDLYASNQTIPGSLTSSARQTFRDHYVMRLAETYLIRAEAHLGSGNTTLAAADINELRRRAGAPDVVPGDVDIDYILDERLRELHFEEFRLLTLTRLGKLVERARAHNPVFVGHSIQDYHNLWPIPFSEIEANTEAVLEQNPGYFE